MPRYLLPALLNVLIVASTLFALPQAYAQESVQSVITIVREEGVQISNIEDWDMGTWANADTSLPAPRYTDNTCVYSSTGLYALTINSQNGTNRLRVISPDGERIRYNIVIRYEDGTALAREVVTTPNTTINGMTGRLNLGCSTGRPWNLRFIPLINRNQFNNALPGVYTDVVSLLITPE